MIPRFADHAANERTYLAWIRTAIALIALGFLVEKFDLFLAYLARGTTRGANIHPMRVAEGAGIGMLLFSVLIVALATWRYLANRRQIESAQQEDYGAALPNVLLGAMVAAMGIFLVIYMGRQFG